MAGQHVVRFRRTSRTPGPQQPYFGPQQPYQPYAVRSKPPVKRRKPLWGTLAVVAVLALGVPGYLLWDSWSSPRPEVGDCLTGMPGTLSLGGPEIVDCADSDATYRVTRVVGGGNARNATHEKVCGSLRNGESYVHGRSGGNGTTRTFRWAICAVPLDR